MVSNLSFSDQWVAPDHWGLPAFGGVKALIPSIGRISNISARNACAVAFAAGATVGAVGLFCCSEEWRGRASGKRDKADSDTELPSLPIL